MVQASGLTKIYICLFPPISKKIGFKSMPSPLEGPFPDLGTRMPTLPQCVW